MQVKSNYLQRNITNLWATTAKICGFLPAEILQPLSPMMLRDLWPKCRAPQIFYLYAQDLVNPAKQPSMVCIAHQNADGLFMGLYKRTQ